MPTEAKHPANLIRERGASTSGINLGGIGTGGVELWPDGRLHFWNFANSMPWSSYHKIDDPAIAPHLVDPIQPLPMDADFMIRIKEPGRRPAYRWLFTGHGLACGTASHFFRHHKYFFIKGFPEIEYRAEYPFIHLRYIDPSLPIELSLRAWTPFIPRDVKNSSLPGAYFDFTVKNRTRRQVDVSIIWQMQNISGYAAPAVTQRHVKLRRDGAEIVQMMGSLAAAEHDTSGDMAIWAKPQRGQKATAVSANPYMQNLIWSIHLTGGLSGPLMPERLKREELNETPRPGAPNKGWLAMQQQVRGNATAAMSFGLAWFFPNHYSIRATRVGHMYENWFGSSADVAVYLAKRHDALLEQSALLPSELMRSSLPEALKLALLDQLSTVTKSSHFIKNGRVGVQEGHGCCAFNTVDVDHYASYALSILFPSLREKIMEMHTSMAHPLNGKINHGPPATVEELPAGGDDSGGYSRWDNCCQYTLQLYRDAKWSGNRAMIDAAYQTARRAMKLVADLDFYGIGLPYIEGGITYDHWDMRGVVGYMAGVYLAGLRALEDMAGIVGDAETKTWARERFDMGVRAFEEYLWNGTQYVLFYGRRPRGWKPSDETRGEKKHFDAQRPPEEFCGTSCECQREKPYVEIKDTGVMTDLLNGNGTAAVMGLGAFLDPARVKKHLKLVLRRNKLDDTFAVINGSYPDEHFLDEWPFMQWQTPWTGTEYFLALQLYAAGMVKEGDEVIGLVHKRHAREGMRFDHAECNNHYSRPLSIWGAYTARLGLDVDGIRKTVTIAPADGKAYNGALVTAKAIGRLSFRPSRRKLAVSVDVLDGVLEMRTLTLACGFKAQSATASVNGNAVRATLEAGKGTATLRFSKDVKLKKGGKVAVAMV